MLVSDPMHPVFPMVGGYYPLSHIHTSFKSLSLDLLRPVHEEEILVRQIWHVYKNLFNREPTVLEYLQRSGNKVIYCLGMEMIGWRCHLKQSCCTDMKGFPAFLSLT